METLGVIFEFEDFCGGEKSEDFCDVLLFFFSLFGFFSLPEAVGVRLSPECEDWRIFCDGDKSEDFAIFFLRGL